jgi:peptidase E
MDHRRQIIALGGGGFSMEPDNTLLDDYILAQTGKDNPKVCFLPTASGDAQTYVDKFFEYFRLKPCQPDYLSLFHGKTSSLEDFLLHQDVIYVGGGNTRNMLALWQNWGIDKILRKAYDRSIVLAGLSAGSNCWYEECVTDSVPGKLTALKCLGFLKGSHCPHYDGEAHRRPAYHQLLKNGEIIPGIAAEDCVGLHYVDGILHKVVTSVPSKRAYELFVDGNEVRERPLVPQCLD